MVEIKVVKKVVLHCGDCPYLKVHRDADTFDSESTMVCTHPNMIEDMLIIDTRRFHPACPVNSFNLFDGSKEVDLT